MNAPVLAFSDFKKPFLLEMDASGKGLRAVLSQKQDDGRYHPVAYASQTMNETKQQYHSNKQEFLALKWAVMEQFHEYLPPYGKNISLLSARITILSLTSSLLPISMQLVISGWPVWQITTSLWSTKRGKIIAVADFLSRMENHLPEEEVEEALRRVKIPAPGVKAMLDNADTPITERAGGG